MERSLPAGPLTVQKRLPGPVGSIPSFPFTGCMTLGNAEETIMMELNNTGVRLKGPSASSYHCLGDTEQELPSSCAWPCSAGFSGTNVTSHTPGSHSGRTLKDE